MAFSNSSILLKVALVVLCVALIIHIVGLATPNWNIITVGEDSQYNGLWKVCGTRGGQTVCVDYNGQDIDWIKACQAFGIIGVLLVTAAAIVDGLCIFVLTKDKHKLAFVSTAIAAFLGATSILITIIIFGAKNNSDFDQPPLEYDLSWSFGMSVAGGILALIGGILVSVDVVQNP